MRNRIVTFQLGCFCSCECPAGACGNIFLPEAYPRCKEPFMTGLYETTKWEVHICSCPPQIQSCKFKPLYALRQEIATLVQLPPHVATRAVMVERIRLVLRVQISDPVNPKTAGIVVLVIRHRRSALKPGRWLNRSPKPGASQVCQAEQLRFA